MLFSCASSSAKSQSSAYSCLWYHTITETAVQIYVKLYCTGKSISRLHSLLSVLPRLSYFHKQCMKHTVLGHTYSAPLSSLNHLYTLQFYALWKENISSISVLLVGFSRYIRKIRSFILFLWTKAVRASPILNVPYKSQSSVAALSYIFILLSSCQDITLLRYICLRVLRAQRAKRLRSPHRNTIFFY